MTEIDSLQQDIIDKILAADRHGATASVEDWAARHGYERAMANVLDPVVRAIGELWVDGKNSLAQTYIAAKVVEDVMGNAAKEIDIQGGSKGPVIIGNIEDDYHALGRRLVVTFLRSSGWQVVDLGNDVPPHEFVDAALETGARVIGASAMMYTTAMNIKHLRTEIDGRGLADRLQLAVGGAVFVVRPGLVQEVGGDGTATNGIAVPALMDRLWKRAVDQVELP